MRSRDLDTSQVRIAENSSVLVRNAPAVQCFPEHATIKEMNAACKSGDFDLLRKLIGAWKITLDPPPGPPGHEIYALEPVFYLAIQESHAEIVDYFFDQGIKLCRLAANQALSCRSTPGVFQSLFDRGWDIHDNPPEAGCWFPWSPLCIIILSGDNVKYEVVKWFLDYGANHNADCRGTKGVTNFMYAASISPFSVVQLMYNYGGRPTGIILPFAISRRKDCYKVIQLLLDVGADIDAIDSEPYEVFGGWNRGSAATIASSDPIEDKVLELLLARGARTDIQNFEGLTCLDVARKWGSKRKVELIELYNKR